MKTMSKTRRRVAAPLVLLTMTVVPAACGDDDDDGGGAAPTTASSAAPTTPSTPVTTTSSTPATTTGSTPAATPPATPPMVEQANIGPPNITTYALGLGLQLDTSLGDMCTDLFSMPNEAIVYISDGARRETATADLWAGLSAALGDFVENPDDNQLATQESPAEPVFRLQLTRNLLAEQLAELNEQLAGSFGPGNVLLDLNHVGPYLPAPTFHPAGDPGPATTPTEPSVELQGAQHRVLVVDSPDSTPVDEWNEAWTGAASDRTADGKVDFVTGHGAFVVDLIRRLAPGADVTLSGVMHEPSAVPIPGFLFTELDVVRAVEQGLGSVAIEIEDGRLPARAYSGDPVDVINFSLGTVGCREAGHDVLAQVLNDVLTLPYGWDGESGEEGAGEATMFVAAAGNDGLDITERDLQPHPHYPAGFAALGPPLSDHVIGVGALDASEQIEEWSNLCVVSAWAPGIATAAFPWLATTPQLATWAGTSFATARVTAALADDPRPLMDTWSEAVTNGAFADPAIKVEPSAIPC